MLPSRMFFDDMLSDLTVDSKCKCDVYEIDNKYVVEMDLPGYKKEDVKVECNKGNLVIKAEVKKEEEDNKKYVHQERRMYGKIERSFHLNDIDEDSINAELRDGILKITIDKIDEDKNKKYIEVK